MSPDVETLLDELVRRHARGEPLDVEGALARAGDRADELAALIETFLVLAPRNSPTPAATEFVRSLDDPPLVRARVAKALKVDDVVDAIVRACGLREESRPKVRRYYQQLEGGVLSPAPVADSVWEAITGLLGRSREWLSASRGVVPAAAPMYRAERLFDAPPPAAAPSRAEPDPPDEVDALFLGTP